MTDKTLKQLITPVPQPGEEFVQKVMHQLPKTDWSWQPVWTIRLVALAVGVAVLAFSHELTSIASHLLLLMHGSWTVMLSAGLLIAGFTLWICRQQELI